jgi:hypothetical protein
MSIAWGGCAVTATLPHLKLPLLYTPPPSTRACVFVALHPLGRPFPHMPPPPSSSSPQRVAGEGLAGGQPPGLILHGGGGHQVPREPAHPAQRALCGRVGGGGGKGGWGRSRERRAKGLRRKWVGEEQGRDGE